MTVANVIIKPLHYMEVLFSLPGRKTKVKGTRRHKMDMIHRTHKQARKETRKTLGTVGCISLKQNMHIINRIIIGGQQHMR